MATKRLPPKSATSAKLAKPAASPPAPERTNEFAGLSDDARHDLAVTRIRSLWVGAVGAVVGMGQTLVDACHDGNDDAALADEEGRNPLLRRIVTSLGTVEGGPSDTTLKNARRIVATNATYRSHFWKVLPFSHKVALRPLHDTDKVAEGAQHAIELGWTQKQLERWVEVERKRAGVPKRKRGVRLGGTRAALTRVVSSVDPESLDRLGADYGALGRVERKRVRDELERAATALAKLRRKLASIDGDSNG
jgi:hypothetical protein